MTDRVGAAVVSVGNELLNGETVDTNSAWIGRRLTGMGIEIRRRFTVADDAGEIRTAVREGIESADLVIVSGGLGPTRDDLTRPAVAEMFGRTLRVNDALLEALRARFRARGLDELPPSNITQAEIPEGAVVFENAYGTAPGLAVETDAAVVVLLPGVPREMRGIFDDHVRLYLRERFTDRLTAIEHRVIHTTGVPESRLGELLEGALPPADDAVRVAFLPDLRGVDLRLTATAPDAELARRLLDEAEASIAPVVVPWRFIAESGDIVEAVTDALLGRGWRMAVAESCTGGLIGKRMTDRAGASEIFRGGVIAYDNFVKMNVLGVSPDALEAHGAVSEEVAAQMATGACRRFETELGIGVTGVAGPGGGSRTKPVGTVWIASAHEGGVVTELHRFVGDRRAVRERAAQAALALALGALQG
jgi:competence/damage-inducible protein CinA-like protein